MPTEPESGRSRVAADAASRGIELEFVERTNARSLEEAAEILGIQPADIVKSLVVKRHDGTFLFAEIPGDRQISWAKLRAVVGVNKLQLPEATIALEATGYERGTITPLGSTTARGRCTSTSASSAAASHWAPGSMGSARSPTPIS